MPVTRKQSRTFSLPPFIFHRGSVDPFSLELRIIMMADIHARFRIGYSKLIHWLKVLKFNRYFNIFILLNNYYSIID